MSINHQIFREYDIRGLVNVDLTEESVCLLARSIGTYFRQHNVKRISLGYDARQSSLLFRDILINELTNTGIDVLNIGLVPTPVLYFSLFKEDVQAGIMITGSHNPAEFNGFKICLEKSSIYGEQIQEIMEISERKNFLEGQGVIEEKNIIPKYLNFVCENVRLGQRKLKVVVDGGNGVGGFVGSPLYKRLGCEIVDLFIEPDSRFPNHHPDPTLPENMESAIKTVLETNADLAIAFDGDGDRIGVVDEMGNIIWGDELMIIFARSILEKEKNAIFVAEVKCSQRLFDDIEKRGGQAIMWKVGHSLIKEKIKQSNAILAGEMSGHMFFADRFFGFDDAMYAGARLLEILSNTDMSVSELLADLPQVFNTPEIRIECPEDKKKEIVRNLAKEFAKTNEVITVDGVRILFEDGWGLVRASNTEPTLVLRFEATNKISLNAIQDVVESKVRKFME